MLNVTAGYAPGGSRTGAVWTALDVNSCDRPLTDNMVTITVTNLDTGGVEFQFGPWFVYPGTLPVVDYDNAHINTNYQVEVQVHSASSGELLEMQTVAVRTPKGKGSR